MRDATSALWCSNRGMSEAELTELLGVRYVFSLYSYTALSISKFLVGALERMF